jgi:hypothetical protein
MCNQGPLSGLALLQARLLQSRAWGLAPHRVWMRIW